jgi:hypothetical protein
LLVQMAVPLLTQKIVKKRVKQFKRPHLDRYKCLKVGKTPPVALTLVVLVRAKRAFGKAFVGSLLVDWHSIRFTERMATCAPI